MIQRTAADSRTTLAGLRAEFRVQAQRHNSYGAAIAAHAVEEVAWTEAGADQADRDLTAPPREGPEGWSTGDFVGPRALASFILEDTPTDVLRNVALIAGALVAWVFAFWRSSIAKQHVDVAKQEHQHGRFQRAAELLGQQGIGNSHARISGLHAFRYLVHDAPDLGLEAVEIVTTLMVQTPVDEHHDVKEFTVARMTAEYICDTTDASGLFEAASRQRLREDVADACSIVEQKLIAAGIDPRRPS